MDLQGRIEADLKASLLAGDKIRTEVLKGLKNALLYEAVNLKLKPADLSDEQVIAVLSKEAKKRSEAAEIYSQAGEAERAEKETAEQDIISVYLPPKMDEDELRQLIDVEIAKHEQPSMKDMGQIVGAVRQSTQGRADGAQIAKLVKEALGNK